MTTFSWYSISCLHIKYIVFTGKKLFVFFLLRHFKIVWPITSFEKAVFSLSFAVLSGKKRKPAWTDRILWRIKPKTPPSEEDDEKASTSTDDEVDEFPLLVTQDKYTSDMSYGVSDHKPVIATFSLEVGADSLMDSSDALFCLFCTHLLPYSWGSVSTHRLCTFLLWAYGAQTKMPFLPTLCKRTSCPPPGTGLACTRYVERRKEGGKNKHKTRQICAQSVDIVQVGFKSASDYETFVWVREEALPEINEAIQVK